MAKLPPSSPRSWEGKAMCAWRGRDGRGSKFDYVIVL